MTEDEAVWEYIVARYELHVAHQRWWGLSVAAFALLGLVCVQVCR